MAKVPAAAVAAGGLVGGYGIARWTRKRPLGGVALAAAGSVAAYEWNRQAGSRAATALTAAYVAAFAGSHPLAKKLGAWPAVFTVAGGVAAASWAVTRRGADRPHQGSAGASVSEKVRPEGLNTGAAGCVLKSNSPRDPGACPYDRTGTSPVSLPSACDTE